MSCFTRTVAITARLSNITIEYINAITNICVNISSKRDSLSIKSGFTAQNKGIFYTPSILHHTLLHFLLPRWLIFFTKKDLCIYIFFFME